MRGTFRFGLGALLAVLLAPAVASAQGLYLPGGGAIQGGMAGVSTATPVDAIGALYWNPAAIGRLGHSEASIGGGFLFPNIHVGSSLPRLDGTVASGNTRSDSGIGVASTLGVVYQPEESRLTYGLGLATIGGGGVNFPGDPGNPVLAPTGPLGRTVIGPIYSSLVLLQLQPTVAYRVTDRLVLGVGPTIDVTLASMDPAFFASPNFDGAGNLVFPSATHSRPFWGGGFRVGAVYSLTDTLDVGFGYTSKQWIEQMKFYARDPFGNPRTVFLAAQAPAIYSWGIAWRGTDRLTLGVDLRYFDYKNTDLFGTPVKDGGLGWDSVFAVAVGGRYQFTDRFAMQAGYQYNTNPLANTSTLFNVQFPAILQNTVTFGGTFAVNEWLGVSLGYALGFENSVTGTVREVPAAGVRLSASNQTVLFNIQVKFGPGGKRRACPPACESPSYSAAVSGPAPESPGVAAAQLPGDYGSR